MARLTRRYPVVFELLFIVGISALIVFGPAACGESCPDKEGWILCGYCDEDALLSENPHAGMCRYCPQGSICGDPCTMTRCDGGGGDGGLFSVSGLAGGTRG